MERGIALINAPAGEAPAFRCIDRRCRDLLPGLAGGVVEGGVGRALGHGAVVFVGNVVSLGQLVIVGDHKSRRICGIHRIRYRTVAGDGGACIAVLVVARGGDQLGDGAVVGLESGSAEVVDDGLGCGGGLDIIVAAFPVHLYGRDGVVGLGNGEGRILHIHLFAVLDAVEQGSGLVEGHLHLPNIHVGIVVKGYLVAVLDGGIGKLGAGGGRPVDGVFGMGYFARYGVGRGGDAGYIKAHVAAHGVFQHGGDLALDLLECVGQVAGVGGGKVAAAVGCHPLQVGVIVVETDGEHNTAVIAEVFECGGGVHVVGCLTIGHKDQDLGLAAVGELIDTQIHTLHDVGLALNSVLTQIVIIVDRTGIVRKIGILGGGAIRQTGYQLFDGITGYVDAPFVVYGTVGTAHLVAIATGAAGYMNMIYGGAVGGTVGCVAVHETAAIEVTVVLIHNGTGVHGGGNVQNKDYFDLRLLHGFVIDRRPHGNFPFRFADTLRLLVQNNVAVIVEQIVRLQGIGRRLCKAQQACQQKGKQNTYCMAEKMFASHGLVSFIYRGQRMDAHRIMV